jgi:transcriptional regulator with XRE-family HTH domain
MERIEQEPRRPRHGTAIATDAAVETMRIAATLGKEARATRRRRRRTQASVAAEVGISRSRYAELERGDGAMAPLDLWVRVGLVLARPLAVTVSRDLAAPLPEDAGHLVGQEWVIARARADGRDVSFELAVREGRTAPVADVVVRVDIDRLLEIVEIWNRLDDLGVATRSSDRKLAEAAVLGRLAGGDDRPYRVGLCWLLVDTAANRALVRRFPAILAARFPGSSARLVRALRDGGPFPDRPAIAWFDPRVGDVRPMRLRSGVWTGSRGVPRADRGVP